MIDFTFHTPTECVFGVDTEKQTGALLKKHGATKVMIQIGGGSVKRSGLLDRVCASLKENDIPYVLVEGVQPNPRLSLVRKAIELCRTEKVDFLLAVGGGSTIDSSKATALGVCYDGDVWDFYAGRATPTACLPIGVVLTIPAAGSEGSNSSVITNEDGWIKRGLGCQLTRPTFAVYNPTLTYTLPAYQTAAGAVDIMAHIMERYFTNVKDVTLTDTLCEAVLKTMIRQTPVAIREPDNYTARAEMMWASTIAHNDFLGNGRIGDWATHNIEHELSAIYDVAHGAGLAVCFPAWMKYNYKHDIPRFVRFATEVMGVENNYFDPEDTIMRGIKALENFYTSIGMPINLEQLGVTDDRFREMAKKAKKGPDGTLGQFVKLTEDDIYNIYCLMK